VKGVELHVLNLNQSHSRIKLLNTKKLSQKYMVYIINYFIFTIYL